MILHRIILCFFENFSKISINYRNFEKILGICWKFFGILKKFSKLLKIFGSLWRVFEDFWRFFENFSKILLKFLKPSSKKDKISEDWGRRMTPSPPGLWQSSQLINLFTHEWYVSLFKIKLGARWTVIWYEWELNSLLVIESRYANDGHSSTKFNGKNWSEFKFVLEHT